MSTKGMARGFDASLPVLTLFKIDDYDCVGGLERLVFDIKGAIEKCRMRWKTLSMEKIKELTRLCIVRELTYIENRKGAKAF